MNSIAKTDAEAEREDARTSSSDPDHPLRAGRGAEDHTATHAELSKRIGWLRRKASLYIGKTG